MKTNTNNILIIILVVLAGGFVLAKVFRSPALESNLDKDIFRVDTAKVVEIRIDGRDDSTLTLRKGDGRWMVQQQSKSALAEPYEVKALLGTLSSVEAERVVSRKKEKWSDYEVGDSSAFRLAVFGSNMVELAKWRVGRAAGGATYVRTEHDPEVYAVGADLHARLGRKFNDWRDKTFLHVNKNLVDKISFQYPADSGFVLEKKSGAWMIGSETADSLEVQNYLSRLQSKDLTRFIDGYSPPGKPDVTLQIEGGALPHTEVKAWKETGRRWVLASTAQPGVYFQDSTFTRNLFAGKKALLHKPK